MEIFLLFSATIYFSIYFAGGSDVHSLCEGDSWIPYKDEKCVKLYTSFATRQRAEDICGAERSTGSSVPSLVSIRSLDEQKFLTEHILNSSDASNRIWIGAQRHHQNSTEFAWNDGSSVHRFTYWEVNRPTNEAERSCVLLQPPFAHGNGKNFDLRWADVSCTSGNWFILSGETCNTKSTDLLEAIDELRRSLTIQAMTLTNHGTTLTTQGNTQANQANTLNIHDAQLRNVRDNPFPIGFIYVQLSGQPEPQSMWSSVRWSEVTSTYAGLFFRAAGGLAAAFGTEQAEQSPRLANVGRSTAMTPITQISVEGTGWSPVISTGEVPASGAHSGLIFNVRSSEVRPRNQAVRIWRRIE